MKRALPWIGIILLRAGRPGEAVPYLERARSVSTADPRLMQALARAYRDTHDAGNAEAVEKILQRMSPRASAEAPGTAPESEGRKQEAASRLLEQAKRMLDRNELEPALEALKESLALHETYKAHSWIAQVYLAQNRIKAALDPVNILNPGKIFPE